MDRLHTADKAHWDWGQRLRAWVSAPAYGFFHLVFARGLIYGYFGLRTRHANRLPARGPAILIGNHNSHLDAVVLMNLFPYQVMRQVLPAAAADYFITHPLMAWFSLDVVGVLPLRRKREEGEDNLAPIDLALARGRMVIFFPEGSRGEPGVMQSFKSGIWLLAQRHPGVPIVPTYLHGMARAMPRGTWIPRPHRLEVVVGQPVIPSILPESVTASKEAFLAHLQGEVEALARELWHSHHHGAGGQGA